MNLKTLRKIALGTLISLSLSTLIGCSNTSSTVSSDTSKKKTNPVSNATSTYKDIKLGVLLIGSHKDTAGYSYAHAQGVRDAIKNLGMEEDQIIWKDAIPDAMDNASDAQVIAASEDCIKQGCNIIFTTSYGYKNATKTLAEKYPDVYFAHGSGELSNGANFINYFGRIYQARYLSGIVAGMKTKTNKIGYVSAWGTDNSECTGGINAFAMGVASVNANAKVYVRVTNSWFDQAKEKAAAEYLIKNNCDVLSQHVDTAEPQLVAQKNNVFGIGYNSDMQKEAPKATLTSVIWNWSAFYTWALQAVGDKSWTGQNYLGGLNEGMVALTELSELNDSSVKAKVDEASDKIKGGDWDVFTGLIPTNTGKTVGAAGTSLDDQTILFGMNWYYKNVITTN